MHIKDLTPTARRQGPIDVVVEKVSALHDDLLRLTLKDLTGTVNLILQGGILVRAFDKVKEQTRLVINDFVVTEDFARFRSFVPPFVQLQEFALHLSRSPFYILVAPPETSFPEIKLFFKGNSVVVPGELRDFDLASLYVVQAAPKLSTSPQKLLGPNNERFATLQFIRDSLSPEAPLTASSYAVVLDCTSSYQPSSASDYLMLLKVTDPSIYPAAAHIQIFHRENLAPPKIANIGDIIRLQNLPFKQHSGVLIGTMSSNSKFPSLYLFPIDDDEQLAPYAAYRGKFSNTAEHFPTLKHLRGWTRDILSRSLPDCLADTKRLTVVADARVEFDAIARYYGHYNMGEASSDPIIVLFYDSDVV